MAKIKETSNTGNIWNFHKMTQWKQDKINTLDAPCCVKVLLKSE